MSKRSEHQLSASKAIKELLKCTLNTTCVWNNIYSTGTRTVKVYKISLQRANVNVDELKELIQTLAKMFGVNVTFNETKGSSWRSGAFIVKM